MKKTFKVNNISFISCANVIKSSLEDEFGIIEVNLESTPKEVTLEIKNAQQELSFKKRMEDLGFSIRHGWNC